MTFGGSSVAQGVQCGTSLARIIARAQSVACLAVAMIRCNRRKQPTWLYPNTDHEEFWVRVGNANQKLNPSQALNYIAEHWLLREQLA